MAETIGRFLDANGVSDEKVRLRNNQPLRARNASDTADINVFKVDSTGKVQILTQTQVGFTPTDANDIASVDYVDTAVATISFTAGDGLQTVSGVTDVLVDGVTLKINGSNQLEGLKASNQVFTLTGTNISNGYVDLSQLAYSDSVCVIAQGIAQTPSVDFSLSTVGGVTRITFLGDLLTAISGDKLLVLYSYL